MMATIDELRNIAHDLYVRAGTSIDPSTKRMLMTAANDYVKQAEELHRSLIVRETELSEYFSATFGAIEHFTKDAAPLREKLPRSLPQSKASPDLWHFAKNRDDCFDHSALRRRP